jgi:hypothetical protein
MPTNIPAKVPFNIPTKMIVKMPKMSSMMPPKMPAKMTLLMLGMPPKSWLVQLVSYHPTMPRQVQLLSLLRAFQGHFRGHFRGHFFCKLLRCKKAVKSF